MSTLDKKKAARVKKNLPCLINLDYSLDDSKVFNRFGIRIAKRLWKTGKLKFVKNFEYDLTDMKGSRLKKFIRTFIGPFQSLGPTKLSFDT